MSLEEKHSWLLIALFFFIFCCQPSELRHKNQKEVDQWLGKKVIFPAELMVLNDNNLFPIEPIDRKQIETHKIVSIIDASCTSCILGQLNRIDSLLQTIVRQSDDIVFILNVKKSDSASFRVSMQPFIKVKGRILWDSGFYFETANDIFSENLLLRTFLINSKREIILVGNPLFQPNLLEEYKSLLNNSDQEFTTQ